MVTIATTIIVCLVFLAEWLHVRRCERITILTIGVGKRTLLLASLGRIVAAGLLTWGFLVLYSLPSDVRSSTDQTNKKVHHMVFALDVSPSMDLVDSGVDGDLTRARRARDVIASILERVDIPNLKVSIIAFYTKARPVVIDVQDPEVIANILDDLPLEMAFPSGKTSLHSSISSVAEIAKKWPSGSGSLVIISDGDTEPYREIPEMPQALTSIFVLGVGDSMRGKYIDGHTSRQFQPELHKFAVHTGGTFLDVNQKHFPGNLLPGVQGPKVSIFGNTDTSFRAFGLYAILAGITILAVISPLLALARFSAPVRYISRRARS